MVAAPDGARGFDVDAPLSTEAARAFRARGYDFCVRYVGRTAMVPGRDLSAPEAQAILDAGLALMVVQHVLDPGWSPTAALGAAYGANAAASTAAIGVPPGVSLWCDLEGVSRAAAEADVVAYRNAWHDAVAAAGYVPGLYVGYAPGLTAQQLYGALRFAHYWGAYNANADQEPAPRGWQLKQLAARSGPVGGFAAAQYDDDRAVSDRVGGRALWLAPAAGGAAVA